MLVRIYGYRRALLYRVLDVLDQLVVVSYRYTALFISDLLWNVYIRSRQACGCKLPIRCPIHLQLAYSKRLIYLGTGSAGTEHALRGERSSEISSDSFRHTVHDYTVQCVSKQGQIYFDVQFDWFWLTIRFVRTHTQSDWNISTYGLKKYVCIFYLYYFKVNFRHASWSLVCVC